jgi:CYTH domain-containing protein
LDAVSDAQRAVADTATSGVRPTDPRIRRARKLLAAARKQVKRWDIPDDHLVLVDGLDTSYRRGRRALRRVSDSPTDRGVHEWRKAVKQLWYQTRLVEASAPSILQPFGSTLDSLAEALGDDHDLSVLVDRLRNDPDRYGGKQSVKRARRLARAQQEDLRRRAFRLAATVYAEPPRAFARRVRAYWELTAASGLEVATGGIAELAREEHQTSRAGLSSSTVERERKYLLAEAPAFSGSGTRLRQGYLAIDGSVSVRVREAGEAGCTLTVKAGRGAVRTELEWPLTDEQFDAAWDQTGGRRIHKTRHRVPLDEHTIEVDVFHDDLEGLLLAEVEFESDDALAAFEPPAWFGPEVTDDEGYTNASLAANAGHGPPRRPDVVCVRVSAR